jgi:antibiotic biosynthesis monooxygenase (ABM) superfamily enzyme
MQDARIPSDENQCEGPVTVSISRTVKPRFEKDYEEWEKGVIKEASGFPGYLGANMIRPGAGTNYQNMTIYRFDSYVTSHK